MINKLKELFQKLFTVLQSANSPLLPYFQPGKKRKEVIDLFKEADVDPPEELIALYEWKNGINLEEAQKDHSETWLLPFGGFMPLEFTLSMYRSLAGSDEYWRKKMVSVFDSTIGEYYLIDCDPQSISYKQIFFYSHVLNEGKVIISAFDSLESFFSTLIECYVKKIFTYNGENSLEYDDNYLVYIKICRKNNPNSQLWNLPKYLEE